MRRFLFVGSFVLVVVLFSLQSAKYPLHDLAAADEPVRRVRPGRNSPVVLDLCRIQLIDRVVLASDRPGILAFVLPKEGDPVDPKHPVAGLRDDVAVATYNIALKQAEANIEVRYAIKAAALAEAEYEKSFDANRRVAGAVPDIELKRLRLAAERAKLQIEKAVHDTEVATLNSGLKKAELDTYRINTPFVGTAMRVFRSKGEAVRQGDAILEVASTNRVRVEGHVSIDKLWKVKPGARVTIKIDIPDAELEVEEEEFEGKIVFVDVAVQPVTRETRIWAEIKNRNNLLRAGLTARMTIYPYTPPTRQRESRFMQRRFRAR